MEICCWLLVSEMDGLDNLAICSCKWSKNENHTFYCVSGVIEYEDDNVNAATENVRKFMHRIRYIIFFL